MARHDTLWNSTNCRRSASCPCHEGTLSIDVNVMGVSRRVTTWQAGIAMVWAHGIGMKAWDTEGGGTVILSTACTALNERGSVPHFKFDPNIFRRGGVASNPHGGAYREKDKVAHYFDCYDIGQSLGNGSHRLHMNMKNNPPTEASVCKDA